MIKFIKAFYESHKKFYSMREQQEFELNHEIRRERNVAGNYVVF